MVACRQTPAVFLESASELYVIRHGDTFLYGLGIVSRFEDIDRQLVEESFVVKNPDRALVWELEQGIVRDSRLGLQMDALLLSDTLSDFEGRLALEWRTLFGNIHNEVITLTISPIMKQGKIPWDAFTWVESEDLMGVKYAYWEDGAVHLLWITEEATLLESASMP